MKTVTYYKFLEKDMTAPWNHSFKFTRRGWQPVEEHTAPCWKGYHVFTNARKGFKYIQTSGKNPETMRLFVVTVRGASRATTTSLHPSEKAKKFVCQTIKLGKELTGDDFRRATGYSQK